MRPTNIVYCFITAFTLLLTGCAATGQNSAEHQPPPQPMTASAIYSSGKEAMNSGDLQEAIRHFNMLITQYPSDNFALQGQLELAYAYHKNGQTSSTIATTERFISDHPQHKNVDYAYYLRGLTAYDAAIAKLDENVTPIPFEAKMALELLNELNNWFPDGKYNADTNQRIKTLNERIAQQLVASARQQLDQNNPAQAALLTKTVVKDYPDTSVIQEAVSVSDQAYKLLGLNSDGQHDGHDSAIVSMTPALASHTPAPSTTTPAIPATENLMPISNTIRDTTWVMSQGAGLYTIQILGTENERLLRHQIKNGDYLDKAAYYKKTREGIPWYSLIYGSYNSREAAQAAAQTLPSSLRKSNPWVRKIGDIQASLDEE